MTSLAIKEDQEVVANPEMDMKKSGAMSLFYIDKVLLCKLHNKLMYSEDTQTDCG